MDNPIKSSEEYFSACTGQFYFYQQVIVSHRIGLSSINTSISDVILDFNSLLKSPRIATSWLSFLTSKYLVKIHLWSVLRKVPQLDLSIDTTSLETVRRETGEIDTSTSTELFFSWTFRPFNNSSTHKVLFENSN